MVARQARRRITIGLSYPSITTANCDGVKAVLESKLREAFVGVRNAWTGNPICSQADCSDLVIVIDCSNIGRRRKRQTTNSESTVQITIPETEYDIYFRLLSDIYTSLLRIILSLN